jgi:hypothetical protein
VISASGTWTLGNDLMSCTHDGVDIQASYVTLNLNGCAISGAPGNGFSGVSSENHINIKIKGYGPGSVSHLGTITGFGAGIEISGDTGDTIESVHITSNGTGIDTSGGSGGNSSPITR